MTSTLHGFCRNRRVSWQFAEFSLTTQRQQVPWIASRTAPPSARLPASGIVGPTRSRSGSHPFALFVIFPIEKDAEAPWLLDDLAIQASV